MDKRQAYILLSIALIILLGGAYLIFGRTSLPVGTTDAQQHRSPPPPLTEDVQQQLAQSIGFSALISYTDSGFEPVSTTISAGEAVRFVNNAEHELLWVASTSTAAAYPGASACGGSAFDTCKALKKGEFWEFTFDKKGVWHFRNNSEPTKEGIITVE